MSVGPSEIFDGADGNNKLERIEKRNRHGKIPCKAFSKYLIEMTIGLPQPLRRRGGPRGT